MLDFPEPKTDREFLTQILAVSIGLAQKVESLIMRMDSMEARIRNIEDWHTQLDGACELHDRDIISLKDWRNKAIGAVGVLSLAVGAVVAKVQGWLF